MFSPITIAAAMSKLIHPQDAITIVSVMAPVLWQANARMHPAAMKRRIERNPLPVKLSNAALISVISPAAGKLFIIYDIPRKMNAKPNMDSPAIFLFLPFIRRRTKPRAMKG